MIPERDPEGNETRNLHNMVNFTDLRVLEVGCGDGRLTRRYADSARQVAAIDPDLTRLITAVENNPISLKHVNFVQTFAQKLPFQSQSLDLALLSWSL